MEYPNDCWQSDVSMGLYFKTTFSQFNPGEKIHSRWHLPKKRKSQKCIYLKLYVYDILE